MKPFACPKCESTEIQVTAPTVYLISQWTGDPEFTLNRVCKPVLDNNDPAACLECEYESTVREFYRGE
jgi:hypothetical protein